MDRPRASSHPITNAETDDAFLERMSAWLIEGLGEDDFNRITSLLKRGVDTRWRPLSEAPEGEIEVLAYREDAGVFTAFRTAMDSPSSTPLGTSSEAWYSTNGEYLNLDLPTHFVDLKKLGTPIV